MNTGLPLNHGSLWLMQVGRLGELFDGLGALVILGGAMLTVIRALQALRHQRSVALNLTLSSVATLGLLVVVRTILSFSVQIELEGALPWQLAGRKRKG